MKIYTKTGDDGKTSLFGGQRVSKATLRVDAYGTIDELNAYIGLVKDQNIAENHQQFLTVIQQHLFTVGALLATPEESKVLKNGKPRLGFSFLETVTIQRLEQEIDALEEQLPQMTHFIVPGGHVSVSHCHVARTICRRAERTCVLLAEQDTVAIEVLTYLNRLSDYLFVLARMLTKQLQAKEIKWIPNAKK